MSNYPYGPPPPPPPQGASPGPYPPYGQRPPYTHTPPRGGHTGAPGGNSGHHQGSGRRDYASYYQPQPEYASAPAPYSGAQANPYWQTSPPSNHGHQNGSSLSTSYPPTYTPQAFQPQSSGHQPFQSPYPAQAPRPPYGAPYGQAPAEYGQPPSQWPDQNQSYQQYANRGGRGGYPGDRGGPLPNTYPPSHHQPVPPPQPPYGYPPSAGPSFSGPPPPPYGSSMRGHGRGGYGHSHRGAHTMNNDRSEKFRHRDQKSHQPLSHQKSDPAAAKKKKRKTNTLGLTPGDDGSDDDGDEEKRLEELLGTDAPVIPNENLAEWIAARKANFPTQARIAKKEAELKQKEADVRVKAELDSNDTKEPVAAQVDPVEKEADRLRKRLAKLDRKLEKRKRAPNDEGDDLRSDTTDEESDEDDDKPEAFPTNQSSSGYLPPPPITRADPTNHCKYYSTGGTCGKKGKCRFVHDPAVREAALQERTRNGGRMTLKQRLLLNDKEQEDMEVIKTIVEMRTNGRLHDPQKSNAKVEPVKEKATLAAGSSLPTTGGEANLPPNPYAHLKNGGSASQFRKTKKRNDWGLPAKYPGWNP
ncbi:hypothetical protein GGR52DRAFT_449478 [Hypoxylon sp. FL1284]|nr:hypothetical protein GGR52DRAFT_449478 [Hypoxylon sp. FL1284]